MIEIIKHFDSNLNVFVPCGTKVGGIRLQTKRIQVTLISSLLSHSQYGGIETR
jgi:hypothetical protein|tara:strand:+ start:4231 stop:4389 length:159 start_codon:yes stop_codon:yes gene_type:complete